MSHAALWRCPNAACPVILGEVRNGVLDVFAPRPRVGAKMVKYRGRKWSKHPGPRHRVGVIYPMLYDSTMLPPGGSKTCSRCHQEKPLGQFYRDKRASDGAGTRCRVCHLEVARACKAARLQRDLEANAPCGQCGLSDRGPGGRCRPCARERTIQRRAKSPGLIQIYNATWAAKNADRLKHVHRAGRALQTAVQNGLITRPSTCESCGRSDVPIEGAHVDYERPLDVRWLCRSCHRRWDAESPKSG